MSTAGGVAYIDSSALVKLVIPEPESDALRVELTRWRRYAASSLVRVEVIRACARVDAGATAVAEQLVETLDLVSVGDDVLAAAARVDPADLRSLDAIHLASALLLGDALGVAIAYDERLLGALDAAGLPAVSPR